MKIASCKNVNFSALLGKKEVTHTYKNGISSVHTLQYIYPFKNEFKNKVQKQQWLDEFKKTPFYQKQNTSIPGSNRTYEVVIEPALNFTKEQLQFAKMNPDSPKASLNAKLFLNSDNCITTITRNCGDYPVALYDGDIFDCII